MTIINWLHLTDFHCDAPGQVWLQEAVKDAFLEDLQTLYRISGPWDIVFFTGDLAFSGREYTAVQRAIDELWNKFHKLGCDPVLLAVPGNHDLQRPTVDTLAHLKAMRKTGNAAEFVRFLATNFQGYKDWWDVNKERGSGGITYSKSKAEVRNWHEGSLPGDFTATIAKEGLNVGVMGLNTAFWDFDDNGKGDLLTNQVEFITQTATNWASEHHAAFLLTHHPPEEMSRTARMHLESAVDPAGTFTAHLYGHIHEPKIEEISIAHSPSRRMLGGASMFGLPMKNEGDSRDPRTRIHGYSAGRLDIPEDDQAKLQIWPRWLIRRADGRYKMVGDFNWALDPLERIEFYIKPATRPNPRPGTHESKEVLRYLKQAFDQNGGIPSDAVEDRFFTWEALKSVDEAWDLGTSLSDNDLAKRIALLEWCRTKRFRGQWLEAKDALEVAYSKMGAAVPENEIDAQLILELAALHQFSSTNSIEADDLCDRVLNYLYRWNSPSPWLLTIANRLQCSIKRAQSEFREARQHGYAALEIARHMITVGAGSPCLTLPDRSPLGLFSRQILLADCMRECGKLEEGEHQQESAKTLFKQAEQSLGELKDVQAAQYLLAVTCYERVAVDSIPDVEHWFDLNKDVLSKFGNPVRLSCLLGAYAMEIHKAKNPEKTLMLFKEVQEKLKDLHLVFLEAHTNLGLGQLELERGNFSDATKLFKKSVSTFDALGKRDFSAEAQCRLGMALEKSGNTVDAKSRFDAARRIFEDLGIRNGVENIRGY
jgi:tetratricopeptide (TPR) repeat protein